MTTVLLTSFSIGRMVRCDPLPPFSLSLPARRFITRAALSLRPRITPPGPRPSLLSVLNAVRRHCSTSAPLSAAAPCPLRSPPAPFTDHAAPRQCNSPPSPLSICTASRLSVSTALRLRRSPLSPLSVLVALLPRRSSFSPFSVLTALRSVSTALSRRSRHLHAAAARSRRSALLTPVPRHPQVEIMPCSNHMTGISAANVHKVSNVTRGTLKQTLEI
jgi:hypothetical protein